MKVKVILTHVQTGICWYGEEMEVDQDTFDTLKGQLKDNISNMQYFEAQGGTIVPGDFVRMQCVINFQVD